VHSVLRSRNPALEISELDCRLRDACVGLEADHDDGSRRNALITARIRDSPLRGLLTVPPDHRLLFDEARLRIDKPREWARRHRRA